LANGRRPEPRYVGWIANDKAFLSQLKDGFAGMVFGNREAMFRTINGDLRPMRVTVIVHRPRLKRRSKGK